MQETEKSFAELTINELITIEKWLIEEKSSRFPLGCDIDRDEDAMLYDNLTGKISDVRDAIMERVSTIQRNTFGDVANF